MDHIVNNNNIGTTDPLFTDNTVTSDNTTVAAENNLDSPSENNVNINDNNPNNNNGNNNNPPQNGPRTRNIDISLTSVSKVLAYVSHLNPNLCKYSFSTYSSHHLW